MDMQGGHAVGGRARVCLGFQGFVASCHALPCALPGLSQAPAVPCCHARLPVALQPGSNAHNQVGGTPTASRKRKRGGVEQAACEKR